MSAPASPLAAWESAGGVIRKCRRCPRLCSRYSGAGAHLRIEFQRDRVNAIAVARRLGAVREHVPEVAAAAGARDLRATHPKSTVFMQLHGPPLDRLPETRPAGPRLELGLRAEQLSSTTGTPIHAALLRRGVRTGERALRSLVAQHLELLGRQSPAPLLFGPGKRLGSRLLLRLVRHDISSSSLCLGRGTIRYRRTSQADRRRIPTDPRPSTSRLASRDASLGGAKKRPPEPAHPIRSRAWRRLLEPRRAADDW